MSHEALLQAIGRRVRSRRRHLSLSQADLAERARVSRRFLIQLERGECNATVHRLADVCDALALPLEQLFKGAGPATKQIIALVGLRGAGKSTVGRALADHLGVEFVELDELVEREARMSLAEIFEYRGAAFYREAEAGALERVFEGSSPRVVAVGGGLVTSRDSWTRLRESALTVWLKASPRSHFERVTAQGDLRPMVGHPDALEELTAMLQDREPLYAMADVALDTDSLGVAGAVEAIAAAR